MKQLEGHYEKFIGKGQERYAGEKVELMKWEDAWHASPTKSEAEEGEEAPLNGYHAR